MAHKYKILKPENEKVDEFEASIAQVSRVAVPK